MNVAQGTIVASRYQLVERLGTGAMGEVWRAQDTRFESRVVAVKFLRDDDTVAEDELSRDRLITRIAQHTSRGELTLKQVLDAFASVLNAGSNVAALHAKVKDRLGSTGPYQVADITALFDELAGDPDFNEHARMRAKLRRFFKNEANSVATLRHDNIVSIFDYGEHEGNPYLVMDYIDGVTLYQVIQDHQALSRARRLRLMEDLCAGLGCAHRRRLVHRDIKPANLIIDSATGRLKILDFGVVRRLGAEATVGIAVGTFSYMSPEQTTGSASLDHRSDIFAVGLVFYELLSGRKAFPPGRSIGDLLHNIQHEPPPPLRQFVPDVQPEIEDIIKRAIEKQPEHRYQDLAAMEHEIARIRARLEMHEHSERTMLGTDQTIVLKAPRPDPKVSKPPEGAAPASAGGVKPAADEKRHDPVVPHAPAPSSAHGAREPQAQSVKEAPREPEPQTLEPAKPSAEPVAADTPAPLPVVAQTPPAAPSGAGHRRALPFSINRKTVPLVAAALVLLVMAIALWAIGSRGAPDQPATQEASPVAPPPIATPPPSTPAPSEAAPAPVEPVTLTEVTIDLRPWARVRIVPSSTDVQVPSEARYTPFTLDLPPGDYTLECENGGVTRAATIPLTVTAGPRQTFTRTMPGFSAAKVTDALLGQEH